MTLPSSGAIAVSQISSEMGLSSTNATSLSFIKDNTKVAYQQASPTLSNYYSKAWYKKNNQGVCDNGDCTSTDCDCGICNCYNCLVCIAYNCYNCDSRNWLQPNCNCHPGTNCQFNCNLCYTHSIDCNCG